MRGRLFFFYGTLTHDHDNAMTRAVLPLLRPVGRAAARGVVLAVRDPQGWYPVLRPGGGEARGWLYAAGPGFGPRALRLLDAYETADRRPGQREYRRQVIGVRLGRRAVRAQAYVHAVPAHGGMLRVHRGDFAGFVAQRRGKSFRSIVPLA
ncbi:gamma-glutamylcyclotransferase family protein [Novosphingobium percolationis]|uniref:gamma-glutamylcyclotransferase family protein n=1 Tax=Novosphingobium percolationis TaxID=2871811 RepID=UPI001CD333D7|nr:gamma-glutamylcyclotransferase family protein [Novosphingobium percolationis]MCH7629370.1 gamma-glutamylcyclotransferase [Pseudomonadota bacterium]